MLSMSLLLLLLLLLCSICICHWFNTYGYQLKPLCYNENTCLQLSIILQCQFLINFKTNIYLRLFHDQENESGSCSIGPIYIQIFFNWKNVRTYVSFYTEIMKKSSYVHCYYCFSWNLILIEQRSFALYLITTDCMTVSKWTTQLHRSIYTY